MLVWKKYKIHLLISESKKSMLKVKFEEQILKWIAIISKYFELFVCL